MRWDEYVEASRRLTEIRGQEASRQSQTQQRVTAGRAAVAQLRRRLDAQADHLAGVAARLREPAPSIGAAARTGLTDLDEAVRRAWQAVDQADVEVRQAEQRGARPALLPDMSTTGRNALIYSAATALMWLVSCGLFVFSPVSGGASIGLLLWSLCGLPAMAFFAGYITISVFGRPRVQPLNQVQHTARLGGLICFGGMVLAWILFAAASALL